MKDSQRKVMFAKRVKIWWDKKLDFMMRFDTLDNLPEPVRLEYSAKPFDKQQQKTKTKIIKEFRKFGEMVSCSKCGNPCTGKLTENGKSCCGSCGGFLVVK